MEAQLDKLILDFAQAIRKLAGGAQTITFSLEIASPNRMNWTVVIQQNDEDVATYSKSRSLPK